MFKSLKTVLMGFGLSLAALTGAPEDAKAYSNDYCREYTRTVYIGNRAQEAYGTACLQPNGDWMIVDEGTGYTPPSGASNVTYVIRDNPRIIRQPRVVYYNPPRYHHAPNYYRPNNGISFYFGDNNRNRRHYRNDDRWDRNDRWDRHDHRGRGHRRDRD